VKPCAELGMRVVARSLGQALSDLRRQLRRGGGRSPRDTPQRPPGRSIHRVPDRGSDGRWCLGAGRRGWSGCVAEHGGFLLVQCAAGRVLGEDEAEGQELLGLDPVGDEASVPQGGVEL